MEQNMRETLRDLAIKDADFSVNSNKICITTD